jgi:hypothetical protein
LQKLVEKSRLGWLLSNDAKARIRTAAVVASLLVAAAIVLGTEVVFGEVAESRRG